MSFPTESELFATIGDVNHPFNGINIYSHQNTEFILREINELHENYVFQQITTSTPSSPSKGKKHVQRAVRKPTKNTCIKVGKKKKSQEHKKTVNASQKILENAGLHNFKTARGRGRQKQLESMTEAQIRAEEEAKLERNRTAARECRLRKKEYVQSLEKRILFLEKENTRLKAILSSCKM